MDKSLYGFWLYCRVYSFTEDAVGKSAFLDSFDMREALFVAKIFRAIEKMSIGQTNAQPSVYKRRFALPYAQKDGAARCF